MPRKVFESFNIGLLALLYMGISESGHNIFYNLNVHPAKTGSMRIFRSFIGILIAPSKDSDHYADVQAGLGAYVNCRKCCVLAHLL